MLLSRQKSRGGQTLVLSNAKRKISRGIHILKSEGILALAKAIILRIEYRLGLFSFIIIPYIIYKSKKTNSNDEIFSMLFEKRTLFQYLFPVAQIKEEIEQLLKILEEKKPKCILEIGTSLGGTFFLWTRVATSDATIISVDLPGGKFGGGYPYLRKWVYKSFARDKQRIILLRKDSHSFETFQEVEKIVRKCGGLDFLFIDGDHTYEGVKKDFEMYSKLVKKGGIIALHDIVPIKDTSIPYHDKWGVPIFWEEIKRLLTWKKMEIVKDRNQEGYGIGVLYKEE